MTAEQTKQLNNESLAYLKGIYLENYSKEEPAIISVKKAWKAGRTASLEEIERLKSENAELKAQAKRDFQRINELEDLIVENGLDETQNP